MNRNTITVMFLLFMLGACTSEMPEYKEKTPMENPYKVELSEALKNAEKLLSELSGAKTRTIRSISDVKAITIPKTRSEEISLPDTLYYLVNYSNNQGFALLVADKRLAPVYAISDEGSLNLGDTIFNKGLAQFFRDIQEKDIHLLSMVGDGYATYYGVGATEGGNDKEYLYDLIHCVWGYGGKSNGYYLFTSEEIFYMNDKEPDDSLGNVDIYYHYNLSEMLYGYEPNK